jgi:hypothetical protein
MNVKELAQKYGVTVGVAGGCLVIGSQFGTCTVAPAMPPIAEEAPAEEAVEEPAKEEPKAEEPKEAEKADGEKEEE